MPHQPTAEFRTELAVLIGCAPDELPDELVETILDVGGACMWSSALHAKAKALQAEYLEVSAASPNGLRAPRGWVIIHNPKPIPDRRYDYDFFRVEYAGPGDVCRTAKSRADAIRQIREIEQEGRGDE